MWNDRHHHADDGSHQAQDSFAIPPELVDTFRLCFIDELIPNS
jgi:hypothetical protein